MTSFTAKGWIGGIGAAAAILLAAACGREAPLEERVAALLARQDLSGALELVGAAIARRPEDRALHDLRVRVLLAGGQADMALAAYARRWGGGGPDEPALFREIAIALAEQGQASGEGLVRTRAAAALAGLASPDLTPALRRAAGHPDASVRAQALQGLAALPGGEAAEILRHALADSDASVRAAAVGGLAIRQDAEDRAALERALTDPSSRVRLRAAASLARQGQAAAFQQVLAFLRDPDESLRIDRKSVV